MVWTGSFAEGRPVMRSMLQVRKPMPDGFPVAAAIGAVRAGHSASPFALPSGSSPPAGRRGQLRVLVWISLTARGVGSEVLVKSSRPPPQVAPVQVQASRQVIVAVICQAPPGWPVEERL